MSNALFSRLKQNPHQRHICTHTHTHTHIVLRKDELEIIQTDKTTFGDYKGPFLLGSKIKFLIGRNNNNSRLFICVILNQGTIPKIIDNRCENEMDRKED